MKLPAKVTPDNLKDSIIELRYSSKLPFDIAIGLIFNSLPDEFVFLKSISDNELLNSENSVTEIVFKFSPTRFFISSELFVECKPGKFIFNFTNLGGRYVEYQGWNSYKKQIVSFLNHIKTVDCLQEFRWAGIRYVSKHPNCLVERITKLSLTIPQLFHGEIFSNSHKYELFEDNSNILITLGQLGLSTQPISKIDIDVNKDDFRVSEIDEILSILDTIHTKQKEVYFRLLSDEYFQDLKVTY